MRPRPFFTSVPRGVRLQSVKTTAMTQHATDEADIRERINTLTIAIRAMDLKCVMSMYAPEIVSFDIEPPLQQLGAEAKAKNWSHVFAMYRRPLGYKIRDLAIIVGHNVAFAHSLNRISGTLKGGTWNDAWVRGTICLQKTN